MLIGEELRKQVSERTLWHGLFIRCAPDEVTVIQGPSGSGKTLLLRALACLDPLESGVLTLDGVPPPQVGVPAWRTRVGYVPQRPPALPGTPSEFATEVRTFSGVKARGGQWIDPVGVAEGWRLDPQAWQRPWAELSGGERQRASLAIVMARSPDYLLLDEPTSALDEWAATAVEESLLASGAGLVWVTHDERQAGRVNPASTVELAG